MLLAFDIGNTTIHAGLWQGDWRFRWRLQTLPQKTADEYIALLHSLLQREQLESDAITAVAIASVVPTLTRTFETISAQYFGVHALILTAATPMNLKIDVDAPEQVGADRIANAIAAKTLYGMPSIVFDFGTATDCEVISGEGAFIGGAITPGLNTMFEILTGKTAQLRQVQPAPPPAAIGRNTVHALQSGIFLGYLGLIEGLITRIKAELPESDRASVRVIGTGGLVSLIAPHTTLIDEISETLTLDGLRLVWQHNHPDSA